ncbi:Transcriptional repressor ILP1 [Camellia lanceoleosa]|uniref:Transcriptional repressor ILP1 n=1 Tax=Camellia lanceoleosa TaxID=1840588 RepID=A0ACC0GIY3_9ERIC|nr:Transcriptional repressor ILP1 [Camellia lanceoleosa]
MRPEFQSELGFGEKVDGGKKGVFEDVDEKATTTPHGGFRKDNEVDGGDDEDEEDKIWEEEQFRKGLGREWMIHLVGTRLIGAIFKENFALIGDGKNTARESFSDRGVTSKDGSVLVWTTPVHNQILVCVLHWSVFAQCEACCWEVCWDGDCWGTRSAGIGGLLGAANLICSAGQFADMKFIVPYVMIKSQFMDDNWWSALLGCHGLIVCDSGFTMYAELAVVGDGIWQSLWVC